MFSLISKLALSSVALLALGGCGGGKGDIAPPGDPLDCRLPGRGEFEKACTIDRIKTPDGTVLTLRLPDGAFRRVMIVKDGRGVVEADGAEPIIVTKGEGNMIELTTPEGSFRLPARIDP